MKKTLIVYSSTDGHTLLICERIKKIIENLMGSKFTVENPNASSTCGCGASFSI